METAVDCYSRMGTFFSKSLILNSPFGLFAKLIDEKEPNSRDRTGIDVSAVSMSRSIECISL